jgi:signal peptidase II
MLNKVDGKQILNSPDGRLALVAIFIFALDQAVKQLVIHLLPLEHEKVVIRGFFKFVHWGNTGAAWSLFTGNNGLLAIIAVMALFILYRSRRHFDVHTVTGQIALGLIFGGIVGNLTDRLRVGYVTDFLYFHLERRGGTDIGFPAFNVADSAICIGVALIFLLSLRSEKLPAATAQPPA